MTRNSATVDVIIAYFNGLPTVEKAVQSALNQSIAPQSIIIVDDGSSPESSEWLTERFANNQRVRVISVSNGGQSKARNFGAAASRASYLAFLDQDDYFLPDHLERLLKHKSAADLIYGDVRVVYSGSEIEIPNYSARVAKPASKNASDLFAQNLHILPSAMLVKRETFLELRGFDEKLRGFEDDDLVVRFLLAGKSLERIDKDVSVWVKHDLSASNSLEMDKSRLVYLRKIYEEYLGYFGSVSWFTIDRINKRFLKVIVGNLILNAGNERWRTHLSIFIEAKNLCPKHRFTPITWALVLLGDVFSRIFGRVDFIDSIAGWLYDSFLRSYSYIKSIFLRTLR